MKEYKLSAWPELPAPYHRTVYRRMLSDMSHRYMSLNALVMASGAGKAEVRQFLDMLADNGLLLERMEEPAPPAGFLARAEEYEAAATIPRLLFLRAAKRPAP